jgi:hypothetical protein
MYGIFHTLNKLLIEPDLRNAISEEHAYELHAYTLNEKYALKNLNQIKCTYRLEET